MLPYTSHQHTSPSHTSVFGVQNMTYFLTVRSLNEISFFGIALKNDSILWWIANGKHHDILSFSFNMKDRKDVHWTIQILRSWCSLDQYDCLPHFQWTLVTQDWCHLDNNQSLYLQYLLTIMYSSTILMIRIKWEGCISLTNFHLLTQLFNPIKN